MSKSDALLSDSKSLCTAHQCPECGLADHITVERVLAANTTVTRCHCRACGHSWHPRIDLDIV